MTQRVQVQLAADSGAPEDITVNTFHCNTVGATTPLAAVTAFCNDLDVFYRAIDQYLAQLVSGTGVLMKCYDLNDPPPRIPILTFDPALALVTGTTNAPTELALCCSFRGAFASGVNNASRRGRIFLGPLADDTSVMDASSGRPALAFRTAVRDALQVLIDASQASAAYTWVVYSQKLGSSVAVTEGWVDDEWDIQRRRGRRPTSRLTFS